MAIESVARRYAQAVFELAIERGESLDAWLDDLRALEQALGDPTIAATLDAPRVTVARKREIVESALGGFDPLRRNLVHILIQGGRIGALNALVRELHVLNNAHLGIVEATVTTAIPIGDAQEAGIARRLGEMLGKTVRVERRVDPSLLGGVVVRMGDTLINGSVAGRLASLREQLA